MHQAREALNPSRYYGPGGDQITALAAYRLLNSPGQRRLALDVLPPCPACRISVAVSTMFLVQPVQHQDSWALWETVIDRPTGSGPVVAARYGTRTEALAGHRTVVETARTHPHRT